jgi:hypothetical protein
MRDGGNCGAKIIHEVVEGFPPLFLITDADDRCGVHRRDDELSIGSTLNLAPLLRDPE